MIAAIVIGSVAVVLCVIAVLTWKCGWGQYKRIDQSGQYGEDLGERHKLYSLGSRSASPGGLNG
jgi:hypothetical protein